MSEDVDTDAVWRPDWSGPEPERSDSLTFSPSPRSEPAEPSPASEPSTSEQRLLPPAIDGRAEATVPARRDAGSVATSPWAPGSAGDSDGLFAGEPVVRASSPASRFPDGRERSWSFPPDGPRPTDADTAARSIGISGSEVDPDGGIGRPTPDRTVERVDNDDEVLRIDSPSRVPRVVGALGVVLALVIGVVIVRSITGATGEQADGDRLPAAIDERWSISIGDRYLIDAVVTADTVVVVSGRAQPGGVQLAGYDAADGSELWSQPIDSVSTRLEIVNDDLVAVSAVREFAEGRFSFGMDPRTGDRQWDRTGDGVVLTLPQMGRVALADSGRFPSTEPSLELFDLVTGETVPPIGGRLAGIDSTGDLFSIDDDGSVRRLSVSEAPVDSAPAEVASTVVATTSPQRRSVFELGGRYFAPSDGFLIEVGFTADAGRVLLDRRPEEQRSTDLPFIDDSSFFVSIDDRHAVMLGVNGGMGIELAGDELRATWSAATVLELPRRVDGDRVAAEVVPATAGPASSQIIDAVTGELLAEFPGTPLTGRLLPVDGAFGFRVTSGVINGDPQFFLGDLVAVDLDGRDLWTVDDVSAGPFLGDRELVVTRRADDDTSIVFLDEGPRRRE